MNQIKIDLERILSDIDRNIFGGYMEIGHLDTRFKFLDVGDTSKADKTGLRSDVRSALERLNISNIRFPGGNFASGYRWMDGVGPRQARPTRKDLAHDCLVSNEYGTNEFIRFCRALNIEPYLCANCGDGDMREAADWVEYCNGTGETALAKLRREHGFTEPHKVKYWGIGNEVDSPEQIGYKTPPEYARAYTEFSKVMKRVDPDIKLIASAVCSWEDFPLGSQFLYRKTEWVERTQLLLEQAGDRIDYLAIHRYAHAYDGDPYETYMAFAADLNERLSAYEGLIWAVSLERGIKHKINIAVDEWAVARLPAGFRKDGPINITANGWGNMRLPVGTGNVRSPRKRRIPNLETALVTGLYLNAFIRHARSVRLASFSSMPASIGMNLTHPDKPVVLETIFYPFELYSRTCGQLALDVFWNGDTFSGTYKDRSYSGIRTLDVSATLDTAHRQLVVYVVNQSQDKALETTVSLDSGAFAGNIKVSVINGPYTKVENTEETPNQVGLHDTNISISGKSFTFTFEPHSITALVCPVI
ncbi:MAG: alpha-L-arabinofuranosidase C-terminal domain-containing protein [Dehalococcoidales bacterium]